MWRVLPLVLCFAVFALAQTNDGIVVKVALLQMMPSTTQNQTYNTLKAIEFCQEAAAAGADVALFPEMYNIGYTAAYGGYDRVNPTAHLAWLAGAVAEDSDYVKTFQSLAKNLSIAIGVTYLQKWKPMPRNVISLIDRHGNILFTYAKGTKPLEQVSHDVVHTCDWVTSEGSTTAGEDFYTATMDTAKGNFTVGAMICYDRENPEAARVLMLKGAELILTPNACYLDPIRLAQFMIRGWENTLGVAMTNYPAPYYSGQSAAFDDQGNQLVLAGPNEGVYYATFNVTAIRQHRYTWSCRGAYSLLCAQGREPSFQGPNAFGRPRIW